MLLIRTRYSIDHEHKDDSGKLITWSFEIVPPYMYMTVYNKK